MAKMTSHRWQQVQALFAQALEQPFTKRAAWIETLEVEPALIAELKAMLSADAALSDQVTQLPCRLIGETPMAAAMLAEQASHEANIGQQFGNYRVLSFIGAGGMGQVYRAERADGVVRQEVAIKLLSGFGSSEALLRRFDMERRILAKLQHPGIARFLDAGSVSEQGRTTRPYVVMELVDGIPINQYCNAQGLDIAQRVELFMRVMDAVAYAHGQLIVHRDLKPGNVLVDRDGNPRLLDFGIAKPLADLDSELSSSERTSTHIRSFSARYAAPEQVRGESTSVACDIYALGGMLYELLCANHALNLDDLSWAQALHVIEHDVPQAPSLRVAQKPLPYTVKSLSGDLDRIVLHALKKLPLERYASVEAMRMDLGRYLSGEPISLRSSITSYRVRKFVSRYKLPVLLASSLVIGSLSTSVVLWNQQRALTLQRDRAFAEQERAEGVTNLLLSAFKAADPSQNRGNEVKAREVLDQAAQSLLQSSMAPTANAELTRAILQVYASLGLYPESVSLWQHGLKLAAKMPSSESKVRLLQEIANAQGESGKSVERHQTTVQARAALLGSGSLSQLLEAEQLLLESSVQNDAGNPELSITLSKRAFEIAQADPSAKPALPRALARYVARLNAVGYVELALTTLRAGLPAAEKTDLRASIDLRLTLVRLELKRDLKAAKRELDALKQVIKTTYGNNPLLELSVMRVESSWAWTSGDRDYAIALGTAAIEKARTHFSNQDNGHLCVLLLNLGEWLYEEQRYVEAEKLARESLGIARRIWPQPRANTAYILETYGRILYQLKQFDRAIATATEAMEMFELLAPNTPPGRGRIGAISVFIRNDSRLKNFSSARSRIKKLMPYLDIPGLSPEVRSYLLHTAAQLNISQPNK
jgi:eukaryotic-like serine/threonine-protein kinase